VEIPYPPSPKCWQCHTALEFPYYWLRWEEGTKFGCRKCVEAPSTQEGHHYAYEKNSVLLMEKWECVSLKQLGSNLQPEDVAKVE
jgi:hypothetical protein